MRKITHLVLAMALAASVVSAASADKKKGGLSTEAGYPSSGTHFAKDYSGEVVFFDAHHLQIKADGSGDVLRFNVYEGKTKFTPSLAGVRQGSKVKVRSDDRRRLCSVEVVPFYKWLKGRTK